MEVHRLEIEYIPIKGTDNWKATMFVEKQKGTEVVDIPLVFYPDETEQEQVQKTLEFLAINLY